MCRVMEEQLCPFESSGGGVAEEERIQSITVSVKGSMERALNIRGRRGASGTSTVAGGKEKCKGGKSLCKITCLFLQSTSHRYFPR